jgi:hypothetical protein
MAFCKIVDVLYSVVPSRFLRDFLIRSHMERCERCQARLISRYEAEALFVKPEDASAVETLWRKIERRAGQAIPVSRKRPAGLRWEWIAGAATLLVVAAASLWLLRGVQSQANRVDYPRPANRFEISYINVGGAPAQGYIYQPNGSDIIIVWAERIL